MHWICSQAEPSLGERDEDGSVRIWRRKGSTVAEGRNHEEVENNWEDDGEGDVDFEQLRTVLKEKAVMRMHRG